MKKYTIIILALITFALGCLNDIEEAPLELAATEIAAPVGLTARVSDGTVHLEWRSVAGAVSYRLYRAVGQPVAPTLIEETPDTFFTDVGLVNGRTYYYSVATVIEGPLEGPRSDQITAVPTIYSIIINGGMEVTGSRTVTLELAAPTSTEFVKIGHEPDLSGAQWAPYAVVKTWTLQEGDGLKTVYAVFLDAGGSVSPVTSASITLDTYAEITDLAMSETGPFPPGAILHFFMRVGNDERGGQAWVRIEGYSLQIPLYDDGNGGDPAAEDGVYETSYRMPLYIRGSDLTVTGEFQDAAGNRAVTYEMDDEISFTDPPDPVYLFGSIDSTTSSITIQWEPSEEEHITAYRIYRDTDSGVDEKADLLIRTITSVTQSTFTDQDLVEGEMYYYRLFVVNDLEETAGSNERAASTYDAYPDPVVLDSLSAIGNDRLTLTWSQNLNTDFEEYRVYRATSPGVTDGSLLVATISEREITFFDDTGINTQTNIYYYRIYVYDRGGKSSRSNEMSTE